MSILFLIIYIAGLTFLLFRMYPKEKDFNFLKEHFEHKSNLVKTKDIKSNIEKAVIKSNKVASLTDRLDKNIRIKFLTIFFIVFSIFIVYLLKLFDYHYQTYIIVFVVLSSGVIILPGKISKHIINTRIKQFSSNLPYVVDIICICVQSGSTIEFAIDYVAKNIGVINKEVALTFERLSKKIELNGIELAMDELYNEIPTPEVRAFCSTLQQSSEYGTGVYDILITLSTDIREMQLLATEEKVSALSAKMTVPMMLFIMFPLIVIVAGPGFIGMLNVWSK